MLLVETIRLLHSSPKVLEELRLRWSHILVDEWQVPLWWRL